MLSLDFSKLMVYEDMNVSDLLPSLTYYILWLKYTLTLNHTSSYFTVELFSRLYVDVVLLYLQRYIRINDD